MNTIIPLHACDNKRLFFSCVAIKGNVYLVHVNFVCILQRRFKGNFYHGVKDHFESLCHTQYMIQRNLAMHISFLGACKFEKEFLGTLHL